MHLHSVAAGDTDGSPHAAANRLIILPVADAKRQIITSPLPTGTDTERGKDDIDQMLRHLDIARRHPPPETAGSAGCPPANANAPA